MSYQICPRCGNTKVVQRIPVKIILDSGENSDHLLRLGMSVEPKVKVK